MTKSFKPYTWELGTKLPVPLAISAMLSVEVFHATSEEERSRIVHKYAHHINTAIVEAGQK